MPPGSMPGGAASPLGRRRAFIPACKAFAVQWVVCNWFDCLCMLIVAGLSAGVSALALGGVVCDRV